jgi:hypothetical protein
MKTWILYLILHPMHGGTSWADGRDDYMQQVEVASYAACNALRENLKRSYAPCGDVAGICNLEHVGRWNDIVRADCISIATGEVR